MIILPKFGFIIVKYITQYPRIMKKILVLWAFSGMLLVSCSDDDTVASSTDPTPPTPENFTAGSANFSNYLAIGNSLTAGFSDAALFVDGQNASYPNMMASSFMAAGGGSFTIPLMADNLGGATLGGQPILGNRLILSFASGSPAPVPVEGMGTTEISTVLSGPFNNMGVPGAKSFHLVTPNYGNVQGVAVGTANPYFARFASSPETTVIRDALAQAPTFFSLWIGNNDVLSFATSGGAGVNQEGNLDPATYGGNDITDPMVFASVYNSLLQGLTASGAQGVIANIPDVTTIPFFTTVPYNPLDPTNPAFGPQIPTLNATYAGLNQVFTAIGATDRIIVYSETEASPVLIRDEDLPNLSEVITGALQQGGVDAGTAAVLGFLYGQSRQATEADLLVFTSQTVIATQNEEAFATLQALGLPAENAGQLAVNGITFPLEDQWVLTPQEQEAVQTATASFNVTIEALATQFDLGFFDANAFLEVIGSTGVPLSDGSTVTATYATGGGFSLDGVHPSPRGYSLLANEFLKVIETKYGANLPELDPLEFTGLYLD